MQPAPHSSPPAPSCPSSADWLQVNIDRRRFIQGAGLTAAALFFFPGAALAAPKSKAAKAKFIEKFSPPRDFALNPIRPVLDSWRLPQGAIPAEGPVTLDFDLVLWDRTGGAKPQPVASMTAGHLRIVRKPDAGGSIRYAMKRDLAHIACESEITCRAGAGGIEQVESWSARWPGIAQNGSVRGREIVVITNKVERRLSLWLPDAAPAPLIADASLYCNPALPERLAAACAGGKTFTRLDQSMSLRENQCLRRDAAVAAPWSAAVSLQSWLLTGSGIPPTHFLCDPEKRALFNTAFAVSTALHAIA